MTSVPSETRRRPRQREKPSAIAIERRRELQEAAIRSIAEKGYAAVTVAMICDEAGFSRGLIGHYFKGKDDLVLEAISVFTSELAEATRQAVRAAGRDPYDRLHAVVRSSFSPPGFTPDKAAVWTALAGSAKWSPPLAALYRELWRSYRSGIAGLMTRAAADRNLEIDADLAAMLFSQMIEGFWIGWVADPVAVSKENAEKACHGMLDLLLGSPSSLSKPKG
ncbi:AcrR family transcriptional regulator [Rhodoligotrophos appendicifer]|uniref:TetR family transcriptional regulator C-terminal domain-containing protein n=1 Tax=Rhodoligotrophos appendicifer TaxID=987056 RepID=UPI001478F5A5|nr:TetR family transcriptional regulator C-terminal domain-containing protein [Rhodoligotrophos appendicifer]